MRVVIDYEPFTDPSQPNHYGKRGQWPVRWVRPAGDDRPPYVAAYRCRFSLDRSLHTRLHVSADERYELYLNGQRLGCGPERGLQTMWFYESYDLDLEPGEYTLVARAWALGSLAPFAQHSVLPGFVLAPESESALPILGTGVATWEAKHLPGYAFSHPDMAWGTGHNVDIDGSLYHWGWEHGHGDGWEPVLPLYTPMNATTANAYGREHLMAPAVLPAMRDQPVSGARLRHVEAVDSLDLRELPVQPERHIAAEVAAWQGFLDGQPLTLPANQQRRVIIDLDNYYCAYPELLCSGGAGSQLRLQWAECLMGPAGSGQIPKGDSRKGDRDEIAGKCFVGVGDVFRPDGGADRHFRTLWWQAGRYLELVVQTAAEPLTLTALVLRETGYPLELQSKFSCDDDRLAKVVPLAWRCLQACSHETFMDCPYYEQLMYVGDTRLEALTAMVCGGDRALARKAVLLFDASRLNNGLTQSRFPSRVHQIIPPFSLWWISMVRDYAVWQNDLEFVRARLPGVRAVLESYVTCINADGYLQAPNGWNFMDWVPGWTAGVPPDGQYGVSGLLNWQFILVLGQAAELETWFGDKELALRWRRYARELVKKMSAFWDKKRGLWADDLALEHFSEHTQCLALLSGNVEPSRVMRVFEALVTDTELSRCTIYFSHYLLETFRLFDRMGHFFNRMQEWFDLDAQGLRTLPERPGNTRSDCHAWGAHPLFHYFASVLGIRPAVPGFQKVTIYPRLGHLTEAKGRMQHPNGELSVEFELKDGRLVGSVTLPPGVTGTLVYHHIGIPLTSGRQPIEANWG